jgi:hypothetical protein
MSSYVCIGRDYDSFTGIGSEASKPSANSTMSLFSFLSILIEFGANYAFKSRTVSLHAL